MPVLSWKPWWSGRWPRPSKGASGHRSEASEGEDPWLCGAGFCRCALSVGLQLVGPSLPAGTALVKNGTLRDLAALTRALTVLQVVRRSVPNWYLDSVGSGRFKWTYLDDRLVVSY
jgi:hypothetical protein